MIVKFIIVFVFALLAGLVTTQLRNFYGLEFYSYYELVIVTQGIITGVIITWKSNAN